MKLSLSLAIGAYDHVRDLQPQGIDLTVLNLPVEEIFFRFTRHREWQVSEMSFGKVVALFSQGDPGFIAIPVFPSRVFRHSAFYLGKSSPVGKPKDLEGRRVGIPEWAQTAGVYARGLLQHEYGVDLRRIQWVQAGVHQPGRVEKVTLKLPAGTSITPAPERTLSGMLANDELDAAISAREPRGARRLFPDYAPLELDYFKRTRVFPIMHVVVIRRDAYERDRWIAMNLYQAFEEAKRRSIERLYEISASHTPLPWMADQAGRWQAAAGDDLWPYGVEPNRATLEAFTQYAFEQGVCYRKVSVEEMFAPETAAKFKI
jgi:4,5-dihydroxyphthalate decarboxylase